MADTRHLRGIQDQKLVQMYKQFSGTDKDFVLRELKRRMDRGTLKIDLPSDVRDLVRSIRGRI